MQSGVLVSVLIPVYNAAPFLDKCLASVLSQTYSNLEVILVDDASTDASGDICRRYAEQDSRVHVYRQAKNAGPAAARNLALEAAQGEYISFVDADDFVSPDYISCLLALCRTYSAPMAMARFENVQPGQTYFHNAAMYEPDCVMDFSGFMENTFTRREAECVVLWNKLYHKSLWQGLHFDTSLFVDDLQFFWLLAYRAERIAVSTRTLYYYTAQPGSITHTSNHLFQRFSAVHSIETRLNFLLSHGYTHLAAKTQQELLFHLLHYRKAVIPLAAGAEKSAMLKTSRLLFRKYYRSFTKNAICGRRQALRLLYYYLIPAAYPPPYRARMLLGIAAQQET